MRRIHGALLVFVAALVLAGCGGAKKEVADAMQTADGGAGSAERSAAAEAGSVPIGTAERKLVYSATLSLRVGTFEEAERRVNELLARYQGYSSRTSASETSRDWTIRVPATSYRDALADCAAIGRVTRRSEEADDVTLRFYDVEGRLNTKRELLQTFRSYLARANTMEEMLGVEARIAELEDEIDRLGGEFAALNNQIDYATIRVSVWNAAVPARDTLGERLRELFGFFGAFLRGVAVVLVGIVVYGVPVVVVLAALFWLLLGRVGLLRKLWRLIGRGAGTRT
ncbi:MAG: DUF4349 domain-containing protein [Spirochaetaceae bacterium]|jgi:hypothetical protein|nr:DUF4349 domain-containing protein [Spirochaetaceae bacterium]